MRTLAPWMLVGLVWIGGTACMSPYERGATLYDNGEYEAAQREVERALERAPNDPQLNLLMARVLVRDEAYREAISHAETAREAPSTRVEGAALLGRIYRRLERPRDTVEVWRKVGVVDAGRVSNETYRQTLEEAIGAADAARQFEMALELRLELQEIAPDHSKVGSDDMRRAREKVAENRSERGAYAEAANMYETLAEATPDAGTYALERGRLLLKLNRREEAIEAFETYVERVEETSMTDRFERVAETAASNGAPRVTTQFYRKAIQTMQDGASLRRARLRLRLARTQFDIGRTSPARQQVRAYLDDMRQLQDLPLAADIYIKAADVAREADESAFAAEILQETLEGGTSNWQIASQLAEYYAVESRPSRVEDVLEQYVDESNNPVSALEQTAQWAKRRRNYDLAQHYYERVLAESPARAEVRLELARVYAQLGRIDQLRSTLQQFVRRHEDEGREKLLEVASLYIEHKLYSDAEDVLETIQSASPTNLVVADRLAKLYRKWDKPERIHEAYRTWIEARGEQAKDYQLVGERLLRRDKRRQALSYFENAAERGVVEAWLKIADIYKQQRRGVDMKKALDRYVDAADNRAKALRSALTRYQATSQTDETIATLEELIELEPDLLSHYKQLGLAYLEQGRVDAAFQLWRRYVERDDSTIEPLRTISSWFEQSGRAELVLAFYQHWLEDDPDPRLYRLVGDAYLKAQSTRSRFRQGGISRPPSDEARERARSYYDRYLEQADPSYHELRKFAVSMRHMKMWSIAARAYERLQRESDEGTVLSLHLGQSLLHLGRTEEGVDMLKSYYRQQGRTIDDAEKIADFMMEFELYDQVEPFLRRMFESEDEDTVQAAFVKLTDVYLKTGRTEAISSIVSQYLGRASNPSKARKLAVRLLAKRGLYEEAASQIERIREFQGEVMGFKWGKNLFRAGQLEKAREAFRQHASENPYTAAVWLKVGDFYEQHGRPDGALQAYHQATEAAPGDFKPFEHRGRFRLLSGELEAGRRDFREALDRTETDSKHADIRETQIKALTRIGRFEKATELARAALENTSSKQSFFLKTLARNTLSTADPGRAERLIERLQSSSLPLTDVVGLLVSQGYRKRAAQVIEQDLETGSPSSAARAVLQNPTVFTRIRGLEGLKSIVDPLLDRRRSDDSFNLRMRIGEFFIRQGDYDNGVLYLRSSRQRGERFFAPMLAQTYLLLDRPERARQLFQHDLSQIPDDRREPLIRHIGMRYELLGRGESFRDLLKMWSLDRRFTASATRLLMHALLAEGRIEEALGHLQPLTRPTSNEIRSDAAQPGGESAEGETTLVSALEALAAEGYEAEVQAALESLPDEMADRKDIRNFQLHLDATHSSEEAGTHVDSLLDATSSPARRRERRLQLARILMINGHYDRAAETARPGLTASNPETVEKSARFLMQNARASGRESRISRIAETYRKHVSNTLGAELEIGRTLLDLGLDRRGVESTVSAARRSPTQSRVAKALDAVRTSGEIDRVETFVERFLRIGNSPLTDLRRQVAEQADRQGRQLSSRMLAPYRETYPAALKGRLLEAKLAFRAGDVEQGRSVLKTYLEAVDYESRAIERVLEFLDTNAFHVESLNLVDRSSGEESRESLSAEALAYLGYAHLELDQDDRAQRLLDRALERSPNPAERAVEIARVLYDRSHHKFARRYADRAISSDGDRPDAYLSRGLAQLALGSIEAGRSDLERGLEAGINRLRALADAGRSALAADRPDLANRYLLRLARTPNSVEFGTLLPLQLALSTYIDSGHARRGVEFLAEHFPRVAAGDGIIADDMLPQLSTLYEKAGMSERAFELYRQGIRREQIQNPTGDTLPVYLNNLAYTYSTSNRHIEEGFDLVRRAMAASGSRQSSYIDTFGWLLYRRGDLRRAERYTRRAMRSATGSGSQIAELYDHLIDIRRKRGDQEGAFWLKNFSRSLERQQ